MTLSARNANITLLCDFIEAYQALSAQFHGYQNDPVDLDKEGCFV